jgi:hypothetical protein
MPFVDCFRFLHAVTIQSSVETGRKKQMEQQWMGVGIFVQNSVMFKIVDV